MKNVTEQTKNKRKPVELLRSLFIEKKSKNANYSLNAFSRDLGLSASLVSRILSGARSLTLKQGMHIAAVLGFTPADTNLFILGIVEGAADGAKISKQVREKIKREADRAEENVSLKDESPLFYNYEIERFKSISQWYHLAILNLTFVKDFQSNAEWISERLGISSNEAREAIERLLDLGMLEENENGVYKKSKTSLNFQTQKSEVAIRAFHTQMIEKAKNELNKTNKENFDKRLINSITFSCAPEQVERFKEKINQFQDELLAEAKSGTHQEVYQLNCQLFPLTQPHSKTKGKTK